MPKGIYPRKGNPDLAALRINPESQAQARLYDLELRITDLEKRLEKANVDYLQRGYVPPSI